MILCLIFLHRQLKWSLPKAFRGAHTLKRSDLLNAHMEMRYSTTKCLSTLYPPKGCMLANIMLSVFQHAYYAYIRSPYVFGAMYALIFVIT